jgi:chemotaxis signal transduction protein
MRPHARQAPPLAAELNALLERRAERVRRRPEQAGEESVFWAAEFPIGEDRYAIPLDRLRAALPLRMVTPVPLAAPQIIGILRYQGQIVTALSLASLLGGRGWREDPAVLLVVDPGFGRLVALDCEHIPKPVALPEARVEQARARATGAVAEIALPGLQQIHLLDLAQLLDRRRPQEKR